MEYSFITISIAESTCAKKPCFPALARSRAGTGALVAVTPDVNCKVVPDTNWSHSAKKVILQLLRQ